MSLQANYIGDLQSPVTLVLATSSLTNIGDAATDRSETVTTAIFANDTAGAVVCKFYRYEAETTTDRLIWVGSVAANETRNVIDSPVRLQAGDRIKVMGASGVSVTIITFLNFALGR